MNGAICIMTLRRRKIMPVNDELGMKYLSFFDDFAGRKL